MSKPRKSYFVDEWNRNHPVGTKVIVKMDDGTERHTHTTARAQLLGGHTGVVWLDGISGCYLLMRVRPES
jgi:hypothetical protein